MANIKVTGLIIRGRKSVPLLDAAAYIEVHKLNQQLILLQESLWLYERTNMGPGFLFPDCILKLPKFRKHLLPFLPEVCGSRTTEFSSLLPIEAGSHPPPYSWIPPWSSTSLCSCSENWCNLGSRHLITFYFTVSITSLLSLNIQVLGKQGQQYFMISLSFIRVLELRKYKL